MIPVKGSGYRGKFGGEGWDGMWTDMSEIVRPTRDGIHGREFISTVVDIGFRPNYLEFDTEGNLVGSQPKVVSIPLPLVFDQPAGNDKDTLVPQITATAASTLKTFSIQRIEDVVRFGFKGEHVVPLVKPSQISLLETMGFTPQLIEMDGWDDHLFEKISLMFSDAIVVPRIDFPTKEELLGYVSKGVSTFHLLADFHGDSPDGRFVLDLIRDAHGALVEAGIRQETTLIGSGGIIAAEHIPKAILCGLDAVALDTPVMVALQADFIGENKDRETSQFLMPRNLALDWGVQRLLNMTAAWRDQLLEISGAMGLREIRRMRGEMGRAMFMKDLEKDAFAGVIGYE